MSITGSRTTVRSRMFELKCVLPWSQGRREPQLVALERKSLLGEFLVCSCSLLAVFPPPQISPGTPHSSPLP